LFVRPPANFEVKSRVTSGSGIDLKIKYEEKICSIFDMFIAELATRGCVSEPAAPVHISLARVLGEHMLVASAGGGKDIYTERSMRATFDLIRGNWLSPDVPREDIEASLALRRANVLRAVSPTLPTFVAGAYSTFSRQQLPESLIDSWVVVEQYIDSLWSTYLGAISDGQRKKRLDDTRTYSAAVRLEFLHAEGRIPADFYEVAHSARKYRNELAHRSRISFEAASSGALAMHSALKLLLEDETISAPESAQFVAW
jgi:hypothetical protein